MRKLCCFALAFSAAIFAVRYHALPLLVLLLPLALWKREDRWLRAALAAVGVLAALLWSGGYDALIRAPAAAMEGTTATLTLPVADYPRQTAKGVSATVRLGPGSHILLYLDPEYADLAPGDVLTFTAELASSDVLRGEATDAYPARGIFLLGYPRGEVSALRPDSVPPRFWPAQWAKALQDGIFTAFPEDVAPLVSAVVTGNRAALSDSFSAQLQRTGLSHAVAVSGMHISFLAALVLQLSGRYRRRTVLILFPVLSVFALLLGGSPSVVRAVVMQLLLLVAPLLGRENDGPTALSFALMVLLAQNPYAAASVGLQLSFASVAGLMLFSGRLYDWGWARLRWKNFATRFVWASLTTTIGALALTTPLLAYYFGGVSLVAPLSNLLALWAVSLVFLGGLIAGTLAVLSPALAWPVAVLTALPARYLVWLIPLLARVPFASIALESPYLRAWLVFAYGLFLLVLAWRGSGRRPVVPAACCTVTLCAALMLTSMTYRAGDLTVTVLNVGQGQSVVLRVGERTALVDCGGNGGRSAGDLAADYLQTRGVATLDLLVLTHCHTDHADGVMELLERIPVGALALPAVREPSPLQEEIVALAEAKRTQIVLVDEDLALPLDSAALTLYAPLGAGEANEEGLTLLCQSGAFSALFTGDMDATVEKRLVKYGDLPDVDLLMAGHHGSKSSTSAPLLEAVTPEVVTVSAGYNTYGHPNPATLARIAGAGAALYRTDLQGNITITVG